MSETTPEYVAGPNEDLPKGVRFVLRAWFEQKFGPNAWGKFSVIIQDGEIRSWEATQTGKIDDK